MQEFNVVIDEHELLTHGHWRVLVLYRAGRRCERCGSEKKLHAHHIDRDKKNNRLANGEALCHSCHQLEHGKERAIKARKKRKEKLLKAFPDSKLHLTASDAKFLQAEV